MRPLVVALAVAGVLVPAAAPAHEVLHTVERSRAIAVQAYFSDGGPLAGVPYDVFGPADPEVPHQRGRADRQGWVAFVPDRAGTWRVRFADEEGHGIDLAVEVTEDGLAGEQRLSSWAFVLRPLVGLAVLGAAFGILYTLRRRKGARP